MSRGRGTRRLNDVRCGEMDIKSQRVIRLPTKRLPSVARFCRRIRLARGNVCENCGATSGQSQIESHHILDYHEFPDLAKDESNIIVLCQKCHSGLSWQHGDLPGEKMLRYAHLNEQLRERIASYAEKEATDLFRFVEIVRKGPEAAEDYVMHRLEM